MSTRRMMSSADVEEAKYRPYLNTGTPIDILSGKYIPTVDGGYALSGGAGITTSVIATGNKFKSAMQNSTMMNAMARFPDSEAFIYDSEMATIDKVRLSNMSNLYLDKPEEREAHIADMVSRIEMHDPTTGPGESLDAWFDYVKTKRDYKIAHAKDMMVETEILDPDTNKPYLMLLPTFVGIDSWTQAPVKQLNVRNEEFTADTETSKQRTIFMEEGLKKAQLMNQLPNMCAKGGLYAFLTGHIGKKFSIDGKPTAKDLQYMGQDETVKAMGPKFYFLMSSIFKIASTSALEYAGDRRESHYPSAQHGIASKELLELNISAVRLKNAGSGSLTQLVMSQKFGLQTGLSFYNCLSNNKYFGLGSPNKVRSPLLGDLNIGRTKIFDASRTYEVQRAMELTFQLFFIQSTWSKMGQPVDFWIEVEKFAEMLASSTSIGINDVLNSRDWWTYTDAKDTLKDAERPFMTLPNILMILNGTYKPKFLQSLGVPK